MSRTAKCQKPRAKLYALSGGVAESVAESVALRAAPSIDTLRTDLQALWPMLDAADIDLLIEHAQHLAGDERGGVR